MRSPLAVLTLAVALACQSAAQSDRDSASEKQVADTGVVMLTLDKTAYAPGATAIMTIMSQRSDTLGYNPCSNRSVERETPTGWVVHPEPNRMCTMELRLLKPGETQTAQTDVPADVTAGTYRIVLRLRPEPSDSIAGSEVTAASAPFRVPAS